MRRAWKLPGLLGLLLVLLSAGPVLAEEPAETPETEEGGAGDSAEPGSEGAPAAVPPGEETEKDGERVEPERSWYEDEPERLEEVVVTAERAPVALKDLPRAASVVTAGEIHERLLRTTPEALRLEPGVLVQRTNLGGGSPFIRGLTGNQVLLLVDGIRMNNSVFRGGPNQYLNTVDPLFIDRIEVVRGVSSVLYGSDALGGVVHVLTRRRTNYDANFGAGGFLLGRASTAEREETGAAFLSFNATRHIGFAGAYDYRSFGDVDGGGNVGLQKPSGYDVQDFGANLDFPVTDRIALQFDYQHSLAFNVPNYDPTNPVNEYDPQRRDLGYGRLVLRDLSPYLATLELTAALNQQEEGRNKIKADAPDILQQDRDTVLTYHGGLKGQSPLVRYLTVVWGGEYYRDLIDSRRHVTDLLLGTRAEASPQLADGAVFESAAGYVLLQVAPLEWMRLVPGARYSWFRTRAELDHEVLGALDFDATLSDWTWAGHLMLDASPANHFILGVARGFRAPSIDDMTKLGSEDGRFDIPNDDLDPETAISYEAGYRLTHENARVSVFGYYTDLQDLIVRKPSTYAGQTMIGTDRVNQNQNVGEAYIWGLEGDLALILRPNWLLGTALAYTFGQNETDDEPLRRIPPFLGNARLRYTSDDARFVVEPFLLFAGRQDRLSSGDKTDPRIPQGGTDGFVTYNLLLGFHFSRHVRINLVGENLTDVKYKWHGSGPWEAGRNFKGALEIDFGD